MKKKAFITGITGQDGSYLAEFLLDKGYEVIGFIRRSSSSSKERIESLMNSGSIQLIEGDMCDGPSLRRALKTAKPDEIYNLAAMSHVQTSFQVPSYTAEVNALGVLCLLESAKEIVPEAKIYQASTSELFGQTTQFPQNEQTPFHPRSPYGISKLYAFWNIVNYREAHGLFCCNGILFNHESPRRGKEFVSRKISLGVSQILEGKKDRLSLGNLDARRDWGYAKEFVVGMWEILQQQTPDDFILATGKTHTVRDFVQKAFSEVGYDVVFEGEGLEEKGRDRATGRILVEVSKEFFRPAEVDLLQGDPSKAKRILGWEATVSFEELVRLMVESDVRALVY